jgi:hypothetical protein
MWGVKYCNKKGTIDIVYKDGSKMILTYILYGPELRVNLLLGRRICKVGLTDQFSKLLIYFK